MSSEENNTVLGLQQSSNALQPTLNLNEENDLNESSFNDSLSVLTADPHGDVETDDFSTDLLKIESKGCLGCIERLPLWLKLFTVGLVSIIGLLVMGILPVAERSSTISSAVFTSTFIYITRSLNDATLAVSREAAAACMVFNAPTNSTRMSTFNAQCAATDGAVSAVLSSLAVMKTIDNVNSIYQDLAQLLQTELPSLRQVLLYHNGTEIVTAYSKYTGIIQSMLNAVISTDLGKGINTMSYVTYARLNEKNGYMHYVGILRAGNWSNTDYLELLKSQKIQRDSFNSFFKESLSSSGNNTYSTIFKNSLLKQRDDMERTLLSNQQQGGGPGQPGGGQAQNRINDTDWDYICTATYPVYQQLESSIANDLLKVAGADLGRLVVTVAVLLALLIFFSLTSCCCTLMLSKTIVGPWIRLNKLQEEVVSKFVPAGFLHSMGWRRITDVQQGKSVEKTVAIMVIIISNFQELTKSMSSEEFFKHLNYFLDYIDSPIRSNSGYIDKHLGESLIILFPKSGRSFRAAFEIFEALNSFNRLHSDKVPIQLSSALHAGKSILGAIGSNNRMEGVCIGQPFMIAQRLAYYANKSQSTLLTTTETLGKLSQSKGLHYRVVGNVSLGNICCIETVEVIMKFQTAKMKTRKVFSNAVRQLHDNSLEEAEKAFIDLEQENEKAPDYFVTKYKNLAAKMLAKNKVLQKEANFYELLADSYLFDEFAKFCVSEHSSENVNLHIAIQQFKKMTSVAERKQQAQFIYNEFLSLDGNQSANITEGTFEHIKAALKVENEVAAFQDDNMFGKVQATCEMNFSDTMRRFRATPKFFTHFLKSSLALRVAAIKL